MNTPDLHEMRMNTGADIGYTVYPNPLPSSQETAPYLGRTLVSGSYSQDDVARVMVEQLGCPFDVESIKRVWNATGNYVLDHMPEDLRPYDLGFVKLRPAISGKFPSADAPFDPQRNKLYVAATPSDKIRDALVGDSPTKSGESSKTPKISDVRWNGQKSTIKSGEPFEIVGLLLTVAVGDEHAVLIPPQGDPVEVTLDPIDDWQRVSGRLSQPVAACEGATLKMWTHGRDSESPLFELKVQVKVLAGDTPEPATVTLRTAVTEGMMDNNIRLGSEPITLEGENLTLGEGDKLYAKNADYSDDDYVEIPSRFVSRNTATAIDLSEDSGDSLWAWLGEEVEFSEEHGRITFKLVSHGGVPSSEPQTVTVTAVVQFA